MITSEESRRAKLKLKGNKCLHCGATVQEAIARRGTVKNKFEFNHADPSKKHPRYKALIERKTFSTELLDELDKTYLLCVDCHRTLHAQHIRGRASMSFQLDGLRLNANCTGQVVADWVDRKFTFFSAQDVYTDAYYVQIGDAEPVLQFGQTLKDNFDKYLLGTKVTGQLRVYTYDMKEVFSAVKLSETDLELTHSTTFSLIPVKITDPKVGTIWMRGGWTVFQNGTSSRNGTLTVQATYPVESEKVASQ